MPQFKVGDMVFLGFSDCKPVERKILAVAWDRGDGEWVYNLENHGWEEEEWLYN